MANGKIKYLTFNESNAPDILEVVNELAVLEGRKPHDVTKRLILEAGKLKIKQLRNVRDVNHPASVNIEPTTPETNCQGKKPKCQEHNKN